MRYSGENCPYCGLEFKQDDDVVVCPDCATPHHRACWFAHGECANASKHAEGFVWKRNNTAAQAETEQKEKQENTNSLDIVCPDCGKVSPNGTLRCPQCGALLVPFNPMGGEPPLAQFRPGFDANEMVGGMKSGDIALFCRSGGDRYIRVFRKIAKGKKFTWNWAAAFLSPFWFFYRKLYAAGAIFFALFVAVNVWLMPASEALVEAEDEMRADMETVMQAETEEEAEEKSLAFQSKYMKLMRPMFLPMLCEALLSVAAALVADRLYYKKAREDIKQARSRGENERDVQLRLFKSGGTSFLLGLASIFANNLLINIAAWLMMQ